MTQIQLSRLAQIPQSTMSEIESGQTKPRKWQLQKIAKILEVDVNELQEDSQKQNI